MDRLDEVLSTTGSRDGVPMSSYTAPPPASAPPAARTKIVFVYSDEESDSESSTQRGKTSGARTVDCTAQAVPISADNLAELAADAVEYHVDVKETSTAPDEDVFREDLIGGTAALSAADTALLDAIHRERGPHMRACVVAAPTIRDGVFANTSSCAADEAALRPLRHHLNKDELDSVLSRPGYKRFRADEPSTVVEVVADVEELLASRLKPVLSEDGAVRAVETAVGGYRLTVDERELLEDPAAVTSGGAETMAVSEEVHDWDGDDEVAGEPTDPMADLDFDGDDEEDEEGEEELDDALIVAITVQLLQCCEAEDLDPAMGREAARFASVAKPLLARLRAYEAEHSDCLETSERDEDGSALEDVTNSESAPLADNAAGEPSATLTVVEPSAIAPSSPADDAVTATDGELRSTDAGSDAGDSGPLCPTEFSRRIDYHIRRFQRIFRSVYRPRDEPIIVDGVRMDL